MNFLFIHQNFPGQFRHLAPALAAQGHRVIALMIQSGAAVSPQNWQGVQVLPYRVEAKNTPGLHPWLTDMETKLLRADACWRAMRALRDAGWVPDAVLAHPGWGEPLFVKQVWPDTRLGVYAEFFYRLHGADVGFDPEFAPPDAEADGCRLQMKNLNNLAYLDQADGALSPTHWQAGTYPSPWREHIKVAHDGIDTQVLSPDEHAVLVCKPAGAGAARRWTRSDEVITFVARNLEPYRGFHIFMRALPELLRRRPEAQVLIVGDDATGYGSAAPAGSSWRQVFSEEVRPQITSADWARVHFLGRLDRDAFTSLLKVSRVHVYLSYPFVLSWSLIEAMSAGACIVASDTAPVREVITDGEHGRLVDFFDHPTLVERIDGLLDDASERVRLGAAARTRVCERYDLQTACLPQQMQWALDIARRP